MVLREISFTLRQLGFSCSWIDWTSLSILSLNSCLLTVLVANFEINTVANLLINVRQKYQNQLLLLKLYWSDINYQSREGMDSVEPSILGPSYPNSAAQFWWYRVIWAAAAVAAIIVGKSSLPFDTVQCIEDEVLNALTPATTWIVKEKAIGYILHTINHLIVDVQLLGILVFWYLSVSSYRYPVSLFLFGCLKALMTLTFQTRPIPNSFDSDNIIPSILVADIYKYDYFFSGQTGFLLLTTLQWHKNGNNKLFKITLGLLVFVTFSLLLLRQNYIMDIFTGLLTAHLVFRLVDTHQSQINKALNFL